MRAMRYCHKSKNQCEIEYMYRYNHTYMYLRDFFSSSQSGVHGAAGRTAAGPGGGWKIAQKDEQRAGLPRPRLWIKGQQT